MFNHSIPTTTEETTEPVVIGNVVYSSADMLNMPDVKTGSGFVYIIESSSRFKIGVSRDLHARLMSIGMMNPRPITLLHYVLVPRYQDLEQQLHYTFRHRRLHGEWFDLSPDEAYDAFAFMNEWRASELYVGGTYLKRRRR